MAKFTSPAIQKMNLIRYIGDQVTESGGPIRLNMSGLSDMIGSPSIDFAEQLMDELLEIRIIKADDKIESMAEPADYIGANLTLEGWDQYESDRRGQVDGNYGFMAMQFGDHELDSFVDEVIKPALKAGIGYDLVNMRDVSMAGIIDNIMSVQIRNATFVVADLTHDNNGAYWEAGYAEGLGKPRCLYLPKG